MKKYTVEEIKNIYEVSGNLMYEATLPGDYKTNNRKGNRLLRLFKYFEKNIEFGYQCINALLDSEVLVVRIEAASYCLSLNYNIDVTESILQKIAENSQAGFLALMRR